MIQNPRHESFCQAYVRSGNAAAAWREAGGTGGNADVNGSQWLVKAGIPERIAEIRGEMEKGFAMDRDAWLRRLLANADKSRESGALAGERQALREIGLAMSAWYPAGKQEISVETKPPLPAAESLLATSRSVEAIIRCLQRTEQGRAALLKLREQPAA